MEGYYSKNKKLTIIISLLIVFVSISMIFTIYLGFFQQELAIQSHAIIPNSDSDKTTDSSLEFGGGFGDSEGGGGSGGSSGGGGRSSSSSSQSSSNNINTEKVAENNPSFTNDLILKDLTKDKEDYINVIVTLKDQTAEIANKNDLSKAKLAINMQEDKVLSELNKTEFLLQHKYGTINGFAGKIRKENLEELRQNPNVKAVYEDKLLHVTLTESVPLINADDVWNLGITGNGSVVCVVDTGIDYTHPNLGGCTKAQFLAGTCKKVIDGYDFVNGDNDPMDDNDHGTHVAGIVAANGTIKGVAPDAKLLAVKVCDAYGDCWGSDMIAGVDWCNSKSGTYNIVATTMSLGDEGSYNRATCPNLMDNVINTAHDLGISVTVASGNQGYSNGISYPACSPNVISVGSTTKSDVISYFTNTGDLLDILAPGGSIYSTIPGGYAFYSGTSMATPHIAGVIALLKQFSPFISPDEIRTLLKTTGVPILDSRNGLTFPRVDALAALRNITGVKCFSNSDCGTDGWIGNPTCSNDDVFQNWRTYTCNNSGTANAFCSNTDTNKSKQDCGTQGCSGGACISCVSYSTYKCYLDDVYWYDSCGGIEEKKTECGTSGYTGSNYCYDNNVYKNFIDRGCSSGSCFESTTKQKVEDCPNECAEGRCKIKVCKTVCNYGTCNEYCMWQ